MIEFLLCNGHNMTEFLENKCKFKTPFGFCCEDRQEQRDRVELAEPDEPYEPEWLRQM